MASVFKVRVECDEENNVEHMLEQVKWAMIENARQVCGSVRGGGGKQYKECGKRCS